jgi:hypothetical protein
MAWAQRQYEFTERVIRSRRQKRKLTAAGFIEADPTECGYTLFNELRQMGNKIAEVVISEDGESLFLKLEHPHA